MERYARPFLLVLSQFDKREIGGKEHVMSISGKCRGLGVCFENNVLV